MSASPSTRERTGDARSPIGVFDSGVGGLTVLRALLDAMPDEDFVYLGDTARLPYGTRSASTVQAYARQAARHLIARGVKLLVIACNTASAVALEDLASAFAPLPVLGVVAPGAAAAAAATQRNHILVTGTDGTIAGGAYPRALHALAPDLKIEGQACPLFVALAEEGWGKGDIAEAVARRYLAPWMGSARGSSAAPAASPDVILLGCTHFPALRQAIANVVGPDVELVDSARPTAEAAKALLHRLGLARLDRSAAEGPPRIELLATDAPARFARVAPHFLGRSLPPSVVQLVDL